jgi:hypothetical protein
MTTLQVANLVETTYNFGLSNGSVAIENASPSVWTLSTANPVIDADWNTTLLEQAVAAYNGWADHIDGNKWENSVELSNVTCRLTDIHDKTLLKQVYIPSSSPWVGTDTSGSLPWQCSLCVSTYSYLRGTYIPNRRRRSGRFYMPPNSISVLAFVDDGLVAPETLATWLPELHTAFKASQIATYSATPAYEPILVINSRGPFKDPLVEPDTFAVVQLSMDNKIDTQRRRTKGLESVYAIQAYS